MHAAGGRRTHGKDEGHLEVFLERSGRADSSIAARVGASVGSASA
jgi:hypothetical protein